MRIHSVVIFCLSVAMLLNPSARADAFIAPSSEHPWYWSYHGKPVLLLGGSDDDNLFQWPTSDLIAQLDRLAAAGGNVIRNTMSDRPDKGFEIYPFFQREDGKYDLSRWNPAYWARFERMLEETSARNIFVQIEIWDRFDFTDSSGWDFWQRSPYNPANNVNYDYATSGFAARYPDHPGTNRQPFFFTTPAQQNNEVVFPFQKAYVEKLLAIALRFGNVLYCIDNETSGEEAWSRYWAEFVATHAAVQGRPVAITEMWDDWNLRAERHRRTFDHPERYTFVDVSQNNHNKGQEHWDNFLFVRDYLAKKPRPMNTTKTYGADGNKFGHTDQDAIERFWRHLLAGAASIRFHRPDAGLGLNDRAVAAIRAARKLESKIPLWRVAPAMALLSERDANEAYIAAEEGVAYAIYFPEGGAVALDLSGAAGRFDLQWIDIATGEWGPKQEISGGKATPLEAPGDGNWAAAITATHP